MAKRIRGQRSSHRPGGQGPSRVARDDKVIQGSRPAPVAHEDGSARTATGPARPTVAPATALGSEAEPRERSAPRSDTTAATRVPRTRGRTRADSLSSRAAAELVYVTDDLRRIGIVSVVMLGVFLALWLLMAVIDPLSVY